MIRYLLLLLTICTTSIYSQVSEGRIKGIIKDKDTDEGLPFVAMKLFKDGQLRATATSDIEGKYIFSSLRPGEYTIEASYIGYRDIKINGVVVKAEQTRALDLAMSEATELLKEAEVIDYIVPLIEKDGGAVGQTITREEIAKLPTRSAAGVAATVGGVATDASGNVSAIRGARGGATYYIDGIKVRGSVNLPQAAIEQVQVILGGTPANYGDFTNGIISVTTRGAAAKTFGGVELISSGFKTGDNEVFGLDNYGYNLLEGYLSGPLLTKTDSNGFVSPVLGYFITANVQSILDPRPLAIDNYRIKNDVRDDLLENPIRPAGFGDGVWYNSDFLSKDDFEKVKFRPNSSQKRASFNGRIDINSGPNINLAFGGRFDYRRDDNGWNGAGETFNNSLYNYGNNPQNTNTTWAVYGKLTQRFSNLDEEENADALIQNAYYSVLVDYSQTVDITQDPNHKDKIFNYGYIGSFDVLRENSYAYNAENNTFEHNGFRDTAVNFTPSDVNRFQSAITEQYYRENPTRVDPNDPSFGYHQNINDIINGNALVNGFQPNSVYGIWRNVGFVNNSYSEFNRSQFRISTSGSADIGDHTVTIGFEYEQRSDKLIAVSPVTLWTIMRQAGNSHISELDLNNGTVDDFGSFKRITYNRLFSQSDLNRFAYKIRENLGLNPLGTDFVNTDALDPNSLSLSMFSPDQLLNGGGGSSLISYYGFDHTGDNVNRDPSVSDFFNATDELGFKTRPVAPFQPIYIAGYIMDKFAYNDLVFNVGLRIERYDPNQSVLKDPYLLYSAKTAGEVNDLGSHPSNIGDGYVVYVDDATNPTQITNYRNGDQWYSADGTEISAPSTNQSLTPYLQDGVDPTQEITADVFEDATPEVLVLPRIAFSFPISDKANFFAHYDVLASRPNSTLWRLDLFDYLYIRNQGTNALNNPALKPEKTIDYELGFQQVLSRSSAIKISTFYREQRDNVTAISVAGAYPNSYITYGNRDFGTVKGLTINYDQRATKNITLNFSYTLQFAEGTGSDPNTNLSLVRSGEPNLRTVYPYSYDRRHVLTGRFDYRFGRGSDYNGPKWGENNWGQKVFEDFGINFTANYQSGTPYTRRSAVFNSALISSNPSSSEGLPFGSRLPATFRLNVRIDKNITLKFAKKDGEATKTANLNLYIWINNLFNTQNVQAVYSATGSPDDDGFLEDESSQLVINSQLSPASFSDLYSLKVNNPYFYGLPRTIRLGARIDF